MTNVWIQKAIEAENRVIDAVDKQLEIELKGLCGAAKDALEDLRERLVEIRRTNDEALKQQQEAA